MGNKKATKNFWKESSYRREFLVLSLLEKRSF